MFRLGGHQGLEEWIQARRELGLLDDPMVANAARELERAASTAINEALGPLPKRQPRRSWSEQLALINARETLRRENLPPVGYRCSQKPKPKLKPRVQRRKPPAPPVQQQRRTSLLERMSAAWVQLTNNNKEAA